MTTGPVIPGIINPVFYVGFNFAIDGHSAQQLIAVVNTAISSGHRSVCISLSSPGGATDQAFYLYHTLRALPVELITHNIGTVQSAAAILFLAAGTRFAVPDATFLFHATRFYPAQNIGLSYEDLQQRLKSVRGDDQFSQRIIADRLSKSPAEVAGWAKGDVLRDTKFALQHGIIQEVRPFEIPKDAKFYQVTL
jgi:ATP-dependent Clp protease, protease subunit